ncbi:MAG: hypothetical protein ABH834_08675 [Candidatus Altiarchaeota archaeon]
MMLLQLQLYGLAFLIGSLTVASLSDIRRMAAQKDFAEVWAGFTVLFLLYDVYHLDQLNPTMVAAKWMLIAFFAVASAKLTTQWFVLSLMDIAAVTAVMSLLTAKYVLIYYFIIIVAKEVLNPILKKFGDAGAYPFLPVVLTSTIIIFTTLNYGNTIITI